MRKNIWILLATALFLNGAVFANTPDEQEGDKITLPPQEQVFFTANDKEDLPQDSEELPKDSLFAVDTSDDTTKVNSLG
jgi:hypothetical protein